MSTVEFVFLTPVLFMIILAAVQFAMYFFAQEVVEASAQAGARKARATADRSGDWDTQACRKAGDYVDSLGPQLVLGPTCKRLAAGDQVGVRVEADVPSVVPFLDLHVVSTSIGPIERFVPDGG
ncbi:TadE family protein [Kitasatospora sp. KL5]|uniref:TadE family protein n=1 Tax=Kitasatospora sp. KL5 TaxID=3425125 RepID=UPI003D6FD2A6